MSELLKYLPDESGFGVKVYVMPQNGMRMVWYPDTQGPQTCVHRFIASGSQCEDYTNLGGTHVLEHFMFKDGAPWSRFASTGADLNAYTSNKWLVTTARLLNERLMDWLEYQAECMRGEHMSNLTHDQIASEVRNVLDEMMRGKNPSQVSRKIVSCITRHCLLQGNTVPTIGREKTIKAITSADAVLAMKDALLGPSRNTLMVVGHADEQELLNKVGELFANLPRNENLRPMPTPIAPEGHGQTVVEIREDAGATTLGFGWPSPAFGPDLDVLQVIAELVGGPEGARTVTRDLKDDQIVFQCNMSVPVHSSPDAMFVLASVPCSTQDEEQKCARAEAALKHVFSDRLPRFDDQNAMDQAVRRVMLRYEGMVNGQANDVAEALSEGVKCGQVIAPWMYKQRFAHMTPENVRDVASRLLTENNVCIVRYLQHQLPKQAPLALTVQPYTRPGSLNCGSCGGNKSDDLSALRLSDFAYEPGGARVTVPLAPTTESRVSFVFPGMGTAGNWAHAITMDRIMSQHFVAGPSLVDLGATLNWDTGYHDTTAMLTAPTRDMAKACKLFTDGLAAQTLSKNQVQSAARLELAICNGKVFDTSLVSRMNYCNQVYSDASPLHVVPIELRRSSLARTSLGTMQAHLRKLQNTPFQTACVNYEHAPHAGARSLQCSVSAAPMPNYRALDSKVKIANTPSCTVMIAQPLTNGIESSHADKMAHIKLATQVIGNGFTGRLMSNIRDKMGLTYSIAPQVESHDMVPSLVVNTTFNPGVMDKGLRETKSLLADWAQNGVTHDELEIARKSMLGLRDLLSTSQNSAMRHMLTTLRNPYAFDEAQFWDAVQSATLDDVNRSLACHVRPDGISVSVAGSV